MHPIGNNLPVSIWSVLISFLFKGFLDTVYPPLCGACGAPGEPERFCPACLEKLRPICHDACRLCDGRLPRDERRDGKGTPRVYAVEATGWVCSDCRRDPLPCELVVAAFPYDGLGGELMRRLKYRGDTSVVAACGHALARKLLSRGIARQIEAVVPVPLHFVRRAWRGFNQSRLLASALGARLGLPVRDRLERTRYTPRLYPSVGAERRTLLEGAFRMTVGPPLDSVLLVDDIFTTGATLRACTLALHEGGVKRVFGAVVAR